MLSNNNMRSTKLFLIKWSCICSLKFSDGLCLFFFLLRTYEILGGICLCDQWQMGGLFWKPFWKQSSFLHFCLVIPVVQKLVQKKNSFTALQQNFCGHCVWIKQNSLFSPGTPSFEVFRLACHITRAWILRCQVFEVERCDDSLIQPRGWFFFEFW